MASHHDMKRAKAHLMKHHEGCEDHSRAHGGEKVHFSEGKPGKGHNETPGSSHEGRKLTREDED